MELATGGGVIAQGKASLLIEDDVRARREADDGQAILDLGAVGLAVLHRVEQHLAEIGAVAAGRGAASTRERRAMMPSLSKKTRSSTSLLKLASSSLAKSR